MSLSEVDCPNCGKTFSDWYESPRVFCCIGCAFDQDPERCEHGYSVEYCIVCHRAEWLGGTTGAWCCGMSADGYFRHVAHESPRGSSAP